MRAIDIIIRKRDGHKLTHPEIKSFLQGYVSGHTADYQAAALLMAIFFRGMEPDETAALTEAMMCSGDTYDLDSLGLGQTVDKHSTGGVGDKVSLILAPLVAACGVAVPMVSGRGLGHTGGTLDKLESIPGFNIHLPRERFYEQLQRLGVAMIGQSDNFVPADKRLYALRDVTGTVESIPLICASIMSKKVASGAHSLVMDVKVGTGAFMQTHERARELAEGLIGVGAALDRPVRALLTDMNQPLGRMVGNSMEVVECIDCLRGGGPGDLREITLELAAEMIVLGGKTTDHNSALQLAAQVLDSGTALKRFRELVAAQGGSVASVDDPTRLDLAPETDVVTAPKAGYVSTINSREIGNAAVVLGAGRARTEDTIDPGVGLEILARIGDPIEAGQPLVRIRHRAERGLLDCRLRILSSFAITEEPATPLPLIYERLA